ncbi:DnaB-like helicase N-terminal domain-containing protein [Streptomyces sp. SM14]|uniref:DnaB-like helicase N-terminal domain-containing protein n=1 Tax=Streptomyces sp. SM14 TaxID=1736045 RepID=UPI000CD5AD9F|nr:DnaB-like helicase N-terminal domain-containing protein [Streptomyces sp. SM14]
MTPLTRAEQAVLGAVLLDPHQLSALEGWLRPAHFYHPEHAALYQALLTARARKHPAALAAPGDPVPVDWVTDAVTEARRTAPGVTMARVLPLASACPRPRHAPIYGRMVLEAAIHRKITEHATRLHQAARDDAAHNGSQATRHYAAVLTGTLLDLARLWGTDPKPTEPPAGHRPPPATPAPATAEQLADEEWLLSCLSADPTGLRGVQDWLHSDDFTDPGHQHLYRCLTALHHRGEPVDAITVLWEAQRRGYLTDGSGGGLDTERVVRICGPRGVAGSAAYYGEQAVRAALVRTADAAAQQIGHLANEQNLPPGQLIGYALHALQPVDDARRRWQNATGEAPGSDGRTPPEAPEPGAELTAAARARSPNRPGEPRASPVPPATTFTPPGRSQPRRSPAP